MIKPEQIPKEALEAFRIAFWVNDGTDAEGIAAAINAWPGMGKKYDIGADWDEDQPIVVLPLHEKEPKDDQA